MKEPLTMEQRLAVVSTVAGVLKGLTKEDIRQVLRTVAAFFDAG